MSVRIITGVFRMLVQYKEILKYQGNNMKMKSLMILILSLVAMSAQAQIKNEQTLLNGLLVRAGVKGQKPLSDAELTSLCERGFTKAYVLYGGMNKSMPCSRGTIQYIGSKDFRSPDDMNRIINDVHASLSLKEKTFVHCNNGAHASGFVGAIILRTFCAMSAENAVTYWKNHLGGYPLQEPNQSSLLKRIRDYPVRTDLELSAGLKQSFGCP